MLLATCDNAVIDVLFVLLFFVCFGRGHLVTQLELAAKIQRCIDTRNVLLETRRRHKEEQELLQRMQLEQKLKLMQQQVHFICNMQ